MTSTLMIEQHSSAEFTVIINGTSIDTTLTSSTLEVNFWSNQMNVRYRNIQPNQPIVVGFRLEPEIFIDRRVALLQLCTDDECLIFRFSSDNPIPAWLSNFFESENFIFVGLEMESQVMRFNEYYPEQNVSRWMDLGSLLENRDPLMYMAISIMDGEMCVENIAVRMMNIDEHFGFRPPDLFDYMNVCPHLSTNQVMWGCVYAYVPFQVGTMLRAGQN